MRADPGHWFRDVLSVFERLLWRKPWALARAVEDFHLAYYNSGGAASRFGTTTWLGTRVVKCPLDLWNYQEILTELRPDLIIETGTLFGGSAFFLATVCDHLGWGRIVTIDLEEQEGRPAHPRIEYWKGSSTDPGIVERARAAAAESRTVLVILDSDHTERHVLAELRAYAGLVTPGSYLIVEDTNVNGHPVLRSYGPGPMEAVERFLAESGDFFPDQDRESKFLLTFNPKGYLRRR